MAVVAQHADVLRVARKCHGHDVTRFHLVTLNRVHMFRCQGGEAVAIRLAWVAGNIEAWRDQGQFAGHADDQANTVNTHAAQAGLVVERCPQPCARSCDDVGSGHRRTSITLSTPGRCGSPWKFSTLLNLVKQSSARRFWQPATML